MFNYTLVLIWNKTLKHHAKLFICLAYRFFACETKFPNFLI